MMNTEAIITKSEITESGLYVEVVCGNTSAAIAIYADSVRVICSNASHKAWRGFGRSFPSVAEAVNAYKSPAMKAAILAADYLNH